MIIPKSNVKIGDLVYLTDSNDPDFKNGIWAVECKLSNSVYQNIISNDHPFLTLDNNAEILLNHYQASLNEYTSCFKCLHETKVVVYVPFNTIRTVDKIG